MTKRNKAKRRKGLPKGAHRVRIEVKPEAKNWVVTVDKEPLSMTLLQKRYKLLAVALAVSVAHSLPFASVRVHDWHGKFQREMTYPRSSDPCPPKG